MWFLSIWWDFLSVDEVLSESILHWRSLLKPNGVLVVEPWIEEKCQFGKSFCMTFRVKSMLFHRCCPWRVIAPVFWTSSSYTLIVRKPSSLSAKGHLICEVTMTGWQFSCKWFFLERITKDFEGEQHLVFRKRSNTVFFKYFILFCCPIVTNVI